jgi:hypothetical protein
MNIRVGMKIITYMIEGHDDDDEPSQEIDGFNPAAFDSRKGSAHTQVGHSSKLKVVTG